MSRRSKRALEVLKRVSAETAELFERISNTSENAANRSSEVLVGVLGATGALLGAYATSIAVPAVSFAIGGPIAACFGIAAGILVWRGGSRFRIERETAENRLRIESEINRNALKAAEVLRRIKALPKDAPKALKEALYLEYARWTAALGQEAAPGNVAPPLLALPPPTQQPLVLPGPRPRGGEEKTVSPAPKRRDSGGDAKRKRMS